MLQPENPAALALIKWGRISIVRLQEDRTTKRHNRRPVGDPLVAGRLRERCQHQGQRNQGGRLQNVRPTAAICQPVTLLYSLGRGRVDTHKSDNSVSPISSS